MTMKEYKIEESIWKNNFKEEKMKRPEMKICKGLFTMAICLFAVLFLGETDASAKKKVDKNGVYHAALGLQTDSRKNVYRQGYYENGAEEEDDFSSLVMGKKGKSDYEVLDGTFKDVTIKGNGTYSVSLKNADFNGDRRFRKLYVTTDIPNTGEITFSNMIVSIDGTVLRTFNEPVLDSTKQHKQNCMLLAIHPTDRNLRNGVNRWSVPRNKTNTIKISFTVEGFSYDKGEPVPTEEPEVTEEPEETIAPEESVLPEKTVAPESEQNTKKQKAETEKYPPLSTERKVGIAGTIVIAIAAIILCIMVVSRRQH